jgi:hypothetical protein
MYKWKPIRSVGSAASSSQECGDISRQLLRSAAINTQTENTITLVKGSWLNPTRAYCVSFGFFVLGAFCVVFAFRDRH